VQEGGRSVLDRLIHPLVAQTDRPHSCNHVALRIRRPSQPRIDIGNRHLYIFTVTDGASSVEPVDRAIALRPEIHATPPHL